MTRNAYAIRIISVIGLIGFSHLVRGGRKSIHLF